MSVPATKADFVYDLSRLLKLRQTIERLSQEATPTLHLLKPLPANARRVGVLAGSFNPLTRGHEALVIAARRHGLDAVLLLLPVRAVDKETVTRASTVDRALVARQWALRQHDAGVVLVNRGLYVEQAEVLKTAHPNWTITFLLGYDKIVQIVDPRYYADREAALEALFGLASCAVAPRQGHGPDALRALLDRAENRRFAAGVAPLEVAADVDALSSTVVREAARDGQPYEHLVPAETAAFLHEAQPYNLPLVSPDGAAIDVYGLRLALIEAAAAGHLEPGADFARLCRVAREATTEGRQLRAWLSAREQ